MSEPTNNEIRLAIAKAKGWTVVDGLSWNMQEWLHDNPDIKPWPTDIAAAMELVKEAMADDHPEPNQQAIEITRSVALSPFWKVWIGTKGAFDESLPRAICLAWLKLHGIKVRE
jgi:hypothetical protein